MIKRVSLDHVEIEYEDIGEGDDVFLLVHGFTGSRDDCPFDDVSDRLAEIACPTLVIVAVEDQPFREPSREMNEAIANAHLCEIADAAHSPQLENAAPWFAAVREHLASVRSA